MLVGAEAELEAGLEAGQVGLVGLEVVAGELEESVGDLEEENVGVPCKRGGRTVRLRQAREPSVQGVSSPCSCTSNTPSTCSSSVCQ